MNIHLEGVDIEGKEVYFNLEGVNSNIYVYVYVCIYIHIYIYGTRCEGPPSPPRTHRPRLGWGHGPPPPIFGSRNSKKEELE